MNPGDMNLADYLLRTGKSEKSRALYERALRRDPADSIAISGLAHALVALGDYEQAIQVLWQAHEERLRRQAAGPGALDLLAMAYWCLGVRAKAIALTTEHIDGLTSRRIRYGDLAGGVSPGAALYFMAVAVEDTGLADTARRFLRDRLDRLAGSPNPDAQLRMWPGPVALHILGELSQVDLYRAATGCVGIDLATRAAKRGVLHRRRLCQGLFYAGVVRRADGDALAWRELLERCVKLQNPFIEAEWFYARHELSAVAGPVAPDQS